MTFRAFFRSLILVAGLALLTACESAEERAEKHFQKGLELLEAGDPVRAQVEFRNVFQLNGQHREARKTYAGLMRDLGNINESYSQYLRLVEQYPDDLDGRRALAEMALAAKNWDEVTRHGTKAVELAPDELRVRAIAVAMDYRTAVEAENPSDRRAAARQAAALKSELPQNMPNREILIDNRLREGDPQGALGEIDDAITALPGEQSFYQLKFAVLRELGDAAALEDHLRAMVAAFPEDDLSAGLLVRQYIAAGNYDAAEDFLRSRIPAGEADDGAREALVVFLRKARGDDVALAELDRLIEEGTNSDFFRALKAGILYEGGSRQQAIADLRAVLEEAPEATPQTHRIMVGLARMLDETGDQPGARTLVDAILAADPGMVGAQKLQARWMIAADDADRAIIELRTALSENPDDTDLMTLMAEAHNRNGNRELAGELLSRAVEASQNGADETLRYARFLAADERYQQAAELLETAGRKSRGDLRLLIELGTAYARLRDWPRTQHVERTLRDIGTEETELAANRLKLAMLRGQEREEDALSFLQSLAEEGEGNLAAEISIVRSHVMQGDMTAALAYVAELRADDAENRLYRFLEAAVQAASGDHDAAALTYRDLLAADNRNPRVWLELVRALTRSGDTAAARAALDEGLAVAPEAPALLWAKASYLERDGDMEGAIAVYETLYANNTSSSLLANNLASLLTTTRDDPESLERAYRIARRLRGLDVGAFQDTYGWIMYRRGDYEEAVTHLEDAAKALPGNPLVQYHLGMAYLAERRLVLAEAQFERALELAGDDPRPQFESAREELAALRTPATTTDGQ